MMRDFDLVMLLATFAMIFVFLGFVVVHAIKQQNAFDAECLAQGGAVIYGGRGPDLCVRDGLIIMPKGKTE